MATIKADTAAPAAGQRLFGFMEALAGRLARHGRTRTSETYRAALGSFRQFRRGEDIALDRLTADIMEDYQAWLHGRGVVRNTVSFYARILRAAYNRAVEQGLTPDRRPFRHVYTGVDKTVRRALPLPLVRALSRLDLSAEPAQDYARDMFLMSFFLRGMSFIDMALLRKTDLKNGYITYRRRKTGRLLVIAWTPEMRQLLGKYPENRSGYLLPVIRRAGTDERRACRNAAYNINRNLKKIGARLGAALPLTLYVARHSWATAARARNIPLSVISEGMGHDSEATTRIYLASLDTAVVDRANAVIIRSLR